MSVRNIQSIAEFRIVKSDPASLRLQFNLAGIDTDLISAGDALQLAFSIQGEATPPAGAPAVPSITRFILIPPDCGVELKVNNRSISRYDNANIAKGSYTVEDVTAGFPVASGFSSDAANRMKTGSDGMSPPAFAEIGTPAILRGYRILPVTINPIRWNPVTRELETTESAEIELDFTSNRNRENIVHNPDRPRPSRTVRKILENFVLNPPPPDRDNGLKDGAIAYVIGPWNGVEQALQPLIDWRRRMGWSVQVIRVNQPNNAASVKAALQAAYNDWDIPPEMIVLCGDTDGDYPIAFYNMQRGANYPYESDHPYTELEGDDHFPEAAIGRLTFGTLQMLQDIVAKTVTYESTPYRGGQRDFGWQRRGIVLATDNRSGTSSIDVCRYTRDLALRNGYTQVAEMYWTPQNPQPNARQFIIDRLTAGASIFLYRGWAGMSGFSFGDVDQLRNQQMLPFVLIPTCNTGDYGEHISSQYYYSERFLYTRAGGAIGAVGAAGATHTAYNNMFTGGTFKALLVDEIAYSGWATMKGKLDLLRAYSAYNDINHEENREMAAWLTEFYIFNLMGDPAVELFTDIPRLIDVSHPQSIRRGESRVVIQVDDQDAEVPLEGARVCLYKPNVFQMVHYTGSDGETAFTLDPAWTQNGTIYLTVTGRNLSTVRSELQIAQAPRFLAAAGYVIDDNDEGGSIGNGDGEANPTERIELAVDIRNYGSERPDGALQATLSPASLNLRVLEGEAELQAVPAVGQSDRVWFLIEIGGGYSHGTDALFDLTVRADGGEWMSRVSIPVIGPNFEFVSIQWNDEPLEPGGFADCYLSIRNSGGLASDDLDARLISMTPSLNIPTPAGRFAAVGVGAESRSQGLFRLAANMFQLGGSSADLVLILNSENGYQDSVRFSLIVGEAVADQPFGPDRYGYICVDDTDEDWFSVPEFDWVEIDPRFRGRGTNTDLNDRAVEEDASVAVDLPFVFTYYGQEFNEITVCSNGWMTLGDCTPLFGGRNRPIPGGEVPPGIIAAFWDDLIIPDQGGVYYWFDEENHRFVVQWSRLRKLGPNGANEPTETFQVILNDPEFYPSITGDGDIIIQYLNVTDNASCFQAWDTPYATVGIGSPNQRDGLQYTYWGRLSPGAAPLANQRALKFTTAVFSSSGAIFGTVTDAATGEPIEGATVYTTHGFIGFSDAEGRYRIEGAPAGIEFSLTASRPAYNDSTREGFEIADGEEIEVNFALLHPEFNLNPRELDLRVREDTPVERHLTIWNSGNGTLVWSSERRNPGDANADPWERRSSIPVSNITEDSRIGGAVFLNDQFLIAGAGQERPQIYLFNRDGELTGQYDQLGEARNGYSDLTTDGTIIWGSGERAVFGFTPDGEQVSRWDGPYSPNSNLTWDPDNELLWISSITADLVAYDRDGNRIRALSRQGLRVYGLGYWPDDPDDYNLYLFHNPGTGEMVITRMNPANGDTLPGYVLTPEEGGRPAGAHITNQYDVFSWVFIAVVNNAADDRVDVWQLDTRRDWMRLEPDAGALNPAEERELTLTLDMAGFPTVEVEGEILFRYNADGFETTLPLLIQVLGAGPEIREMRLPLRRGWNLTSINIVPDREFFRQAEERGADVPLMFAQLRIDEEHHLVNLIKDGSGRFYSPGFGFNGIPYWDVTRGYQVNVAADTACYWLGELIDPQADIPLSEGWNTIAYFPDYSLPVAAPDFTGFAPIIDHLEIAKDGAGNFLLPEFEFSNMPPLRTGAGYMVKMFEAAVLNYPLNPEDGRIALSVDKPTARSAPAPTAESMSLLLLVAGIVNCGDEIIAIDDGGAIRGAGLVRDDAPHGLRCGLALWGDDPQTPEKDGLLVGEGFRLELRQGGDVPGVPLKLEAVLAGGGLTYTPNGLMVARMDIDAPLPERFEIGGVYPNPFNAAVRIDYALPIATPVRISAYDLSGRLAASITDGARPAGRHQAVWRAETLPSGVYVVRLEAHGATVTRKVVLMR